MQREGDRHGACRRLRQRRGDSGLETAQGAGEPENGASIVGAIVGGLVDPGQQGLDRVAHADISRTLDRSTGVQFTVTSLPVLDVVTVSFWLSATAIAGDDAPNRAATAKSATERHPANALLYMAPLGSSVAPT